MPSGCSTEKGPAPGVHLEVAGRGVEAATLGLGDALEPAEDEALVALAALHAAVLAGHARERGMAGIRAQLGTQGVSAVGWAGQRWWRGAQVRQGGEKTKEVVPSLELRRPMARGFSPISRREELGETTKELSLHPLGQEGALQGGAKRQNHGSRPTRSLSSSAM